MTTETYTRELVRGFGSRSRFRRLGIPVEAALNLPILAYFPFNGILHLPASIAKPIEAAATVWFGVALLWMAVRNRFQVYWGLWTCRILALIALETVCSVSWSGQPLLKVFYPCAIAVLSFFYLNYLLTRFSLYWIARMMLGVFVADMALSILVALSYPPIGIDNGADDPSNAGAWQGIFAQKNQLGMATVLAVAVALGWRSRTNGDRLCKAAVISLALIAAAGSGSREAWIAIIVEMTLAVFLKVLQSCNLRLQSFLASAAVLISGVVFSIIYTYLDRILALLGRSKNASGRTYIWRGALLLIRRRPWLGYGVYGLWHTPNAWEIVSYAGWNVPSSHNNYLEILLYFGSVGLALHLLLLSLLAVSSVRAFVANKLSVATPAMLVGTGIVVLSFASPLTVYYPSAALLLLGVYCGQLEQTLALK